MYWLSDKDWWDELCENDPEYAGELIWETIHTCITEYKKIFPTKGLIIYETTQSDNTYTFNYKKGDGTNENKS